MRFESKNVIILSPQAWDGLWVSKHHVAIELAAKQNTVHYFNPPIHGYFPSIKINKLEQYPEISIIQMILPKPVILRHKMRWLYDFLVECLTNICLKRLKCSVDIVWDFDVNNTFYKGLYNREIRPIRIFHPVDYNSNHEIKGRIPDLTISVSNEILNQYPECTNRLNLGHSVSENFFQGYTVPIEMKKKSLNFGFAANFNKPFIDWETILKLGKQFEQHRFYLFGPFDIEKHKSQFSATFFSKIFAQSNIIFKGFMMKKELVVSLADMHALFVFYNKFKNENMYTNSHKLLEYLMTGKAVLSDTMSYYEDKEHLIRMSPMNCNSEEKVKAFKNFIRDLPEQSSEENQKVRVEYAKQYTYANQIERIGNLID